MKHQWVLFLKCILDFSLCWLILFGNLYWRKKLSLILRSRNSVWSTRQFVKILVSTMKCCLCRLRTNIIIHKSNLAGELTTMPNVCFDRPNNVWMMLEATQQTYIYRIITKRSNIKIFLQHRRSESTQIIITQNIRPSSMGIDRFIPMSESTVESILFGDQKL